MMPRVMTSHLGLPVFVGGTSPPTLAMRQLGSDGGNSPEADGGDGEYDQGGAGAA
jgi:hypothetical protein